MTKLLQSLIVWLMLVAIPFQGVATAGMLTCVPMQEAGPAAMPAPCAEMDMAMQMSMQADNHVTVGAAPAHHHTDGKCGTCASCYAAAMAPALALPRAPAETSKLATFTFDNARVARVDLALPERPPKAALT